MAAQIKTCPSGPALVLVSNNGTLAKLAWTNVGQDADKYKVSWYNEVESEMRETHLKAYQIGLKPGRTYIISVIGENSAKKSKPSNPCYVEARPLMPTGITLANNTLFPTKSILVKWGNQDLRVTCFIVTAIDSSTGRATVKQSTICSYTFSDLKPGTIYQVCVEAVLKDEGTGKELISEKSFSETDIQTYPEKIQGLQATVLEANSCRFSWDPVPGSTSYEICVKSSLTNYVTHTTEHTEFVSTNLELGMKYAAKVAAVNSAGRGEYSEPQPFETRPEPPASVEIKVDDKDTCMLHVYIAEAKRRPKSYLVSLLENEEQQDPVTIEKPSHVYRDLRPSSTYGVMVQAANDDLKSTVVYSGTVPTCPDIVQGIKLAGQTDSSLSIEWDQVPSSSSYRIRWEDSEHNVSEHVTAQTRYTIEGLQPGGKYAISVTASNSAGAGKCVQRLPLSMVPKKPTDIQVKNYPASPHDSVVVTFKDIAKNVYTVVAQPLSGGENIEVNVDKPTALVDGLAAGETYNIYVIAFDEEALKSERAYYDGTIQTYPDIPGDPELKHTDNKLVLTWKCPEIKPDRYKVIWTANGIEESKEVEETHFNLYELQPSTTYSFTVAAVNQAGRGEATAAKEYTTAPAPPANVRVTNNLDSPETSLIVEYEDPTPAALPKKYKAFALPSSGESPAPVESEESTTQRIFLNGLEPGEAYMVYVIAICGDKTSEKAYFSSYPKIPKVRLDEFTPYDTSATIVWSPITKAHHYVIMWWSKGGKVEKQSIESPVYIINDIKSGTSYSVQVAAVNENEDGEFSETVQFQTAPTSPQGVEVLNNEESPETSLVLKFESSDVVATKFEAAAQSLSTSRVERVEAINGLARLNDLTPGDTYRVFVIASKNEVESRPAYAEKTVKTRCAKVKELQKDKSSPNSQGISWSRVFGAESYRFQWRRSDKNFKSVLTEHTEYTLEYLEPGERYLVQVSAVNSAGDGAHSDAVDFTMALLPPKHVEVSTTYTGQRIEMDVKFEPSPQRAVRYIVGTQNSDREPAETETCSAVLHNLEHGAKYEVFVQAVAENGAESKKAFAKAVWTRPGKLTVRHDAVSKNCERIFWEPVNLATSYVIRGVNEEETAETELLLKDLELDRCYTVTVAARNDCGTGEFSELVKFNTAPFSPARICISNDPENQEVTVSCQPPRMQSDYTLMGAILSAPGNAVVKPYKPPKDWHMTCKDLKPGMKYCAKLIYKHKSIEARSSDEAVSEPFWTRCAQVKNVEATLISRDSCLAQWQRVTGATMYQIKFRPGNGCFVTVRTPNPEYTLTKLVVGQKYHLFVTAINEEASEDVRTGAESDERTFHTGLATPENVESFRSEHNPDTCIVVRFKEPEHRPPAYLITAKAISVHDQKSVETTEGFETLERLLPGTEYTIEVQSVSSDNPGLNSPKSEAITRYTCPAQVTDLSEEMESQRSRLVSWGPVPGVKSYELKLRKKGCRPELIDVEGTKSYKIIENLCLNTSYKISVTAINSAGRGRESVECTFQTVLFPPTNLVVRHNDITPTSEVDVNFQFPKPAASKYKIRVENLMGGQDEVHVVDKNFAKIPNLHPGGKYKFYVSSVNEADESLNSEEVPSEEICMPQVKFTIETRKVSNTQEKVFWRKIEGILMYEVSWRMRNEAVWQTEPTPDDHMVLNRLSRGAAYEVKVAPINEGGRGEDSEIRRFITAPPKVTNVCSENISPHRVKITCDPCTGATGYKFCILGSEPIVRTLPRMEFKCETTQTRFRVNVSSLNGGGISEQSDTWEFHQVLHHLQLKAQNQAKIHIAKEKFVVPALAALPGKHTSTDFQACINPRSGETVLLLGGMFCGKTACCSYFIQTHVSQNLHIYMDYDFVKDNARKMDVRLLLGLYIPDIEAEEMDSVYQWMKDNPQLVTFVVDNFFLPDDFVEQHIQYEKKESIPVLVYNLLKTNRDIFPGSQVFCTTWQASLGSWLKPTSTYQMYGFDDAGIEKMKKRVLAQRKQSFGQEDGIPSQVEYFLRHPGCCEIVLRLLQHPGEVDLTSLASVLIEALSKNMERIPEGQARLAKLKKLCQEVEKVPQMVYNTKIDAAKVAKIKGNPRKHQTNDQSTSDDWSVYSDNPSVFENTIRRNAKNSLLPSCDILEDLVLKAIYFGVFATAEEFGKHFAKRRLKFTSSSHIWITTAGFLRPQTSRKAVQFFKPAKNIQLKECEKKEKQFMAFMQKNITEIRKNVYVYSQIPIDWFKCCAELRDEDTLKLCKLEIKVKDDITAPALEEVTKFIKNVPKIFCNQLEIVTKEGTDATVTTAIDSAVRHNPYGHLINRRDKEPKASLLSRKGSKRSSMRSSTGQGKSDVTSPLQPIPEANLGFGTSTPLRSPDLNEMSSSVNEDEDVFGPEAKDTVEAGNEEPPPDDDEKASRTS